MHLISQDKNQTELFEKLSQAVALFYDGNSAPQVTAKGSAELADEIIAIAKENGVPLCENAELNKLLMNLEVGESIPDSLYIAIATIIAFAYDLCGKTP